MLYKNQKEERNVNAYKLCKKCFYEWIVHTNDFKY